MMKFEKKNHHYVPQYWQRGFRGIGDYLYGKFGSNIKVVSPKRIMQSDWLYTVFDDQWNPSDALEDALSTVEAEDARLFQRLHTPGYIATSGDRNQLCASLALQASRHPDVLARGQRLGKELGTLLSDVHSMTLDDFKRRIATFGVNESDAHDCYVTLLMRTKEQLTYELAELMALSPQSSELPAQDAIRAMPQITDAIKKLKLCLLDAPPAEAFVLGDTPLPQSDLGLGFSVPLSKSLAVCAIPSSTAQITLDRRFASTAEVRKINCTQNDNAREVVVGPSAALLESL